MAIPLGPFDPFSLQQMASQARMANNAKIVEGLFNPANFPSKAVVRSPFGLRQLGPGLSRSQRFNSVAYGPVKPVGPFALGPGQGPLMQPIPMGNGVRGALGPAFSTGPKALGPGTSIPVGPVGSTVAGIPMGNTNLPLGTQLPTVIRGTGSPIPMTGAGPVLGPPTTFANPGVAGVYGPPSRFMNPYGATVGIPNVGGTAYSQANIANLAPASSGIPQMPAAALQATNPVAPASQTLLQRLGFGGSNAAATSGYKQFLKAGLTPRAAFTKFSVPATVGYMGAQYIVDPLNIGGQNSALDRFATGATTGAGIGAGIGTIIPIPGISTAVGAGVGALLGGTANTIKGWFDDKGMTEVSAKNRDRYAGLTGLMDTAGLTQRQRQALMSQYETQMKLIGDDTESQKLLLDNLEQQVVGLAGSNPYQVTGQDLIGLQAQIQDYMRPLQERMSASSAGLAAAYNNIASQMQSPQLADAMRLQGSNVQAAADRQILANAATAGNLPAAYALQMQNMTAAQTPAANDLASQLAGAGG